jgi:hypothetical protein
MPFPDAAGWAYQPQVQPQWPSLTLTAAPHLPQAASEPMLKRHTAAAAHLVTAATRRRRQL